MAEKSKIAWTDGTFNPWIGCTKVSPACTNCYAELWNKRLGGADCWGAGADRRLTSDKNWNAPIKWNEKAALEGKRPRIFCGSLCDWLDNEIPIAWFIRLLNLIKKTPNIDWLLLSKRPENWSPRLMAAADQSRRNEFWEGLDFCEYWLNGMAPDNVWFGTTVEHQGLADLRIPIILDIPAKVRFVSCEPLLSEVDLTEIVPFNGRILNALTGITKDGRGCEDKGSSLDWVIVGCEKFDGSPRPMNIDWAKSLKSQCDSFGAKFFMKQMDVNGEITSDISLFPSDLAVRDIPTPN